MAEDVQWRFFTWKLLRRVLVVFTLIGIVIGTLLLLWFLAMGRKAPSIDTLAEYEPDVTSRVHAGDGKLIAEFADQHRVFVPFESIPRDVVHAFVAAEDKKFFRHGGIDYVGMFRGGVVNNVRNRLRGSTRLQGGSTITQQVAKNMLLTRDQRFDRKAQEIWTAWRMEDAFSKEKIMELYLNEIFMGRNSYGVGSASLNYFNKALPELNLSEAAILAALAQAPGTVNPDRNPERLLVRRNYVLGRMVEDGYITEEEAETARAMPLTTGRRLRGREYAAATYFVQELRRELIDTYGEDTLERGGFSIRTTIDTGLQLAAQDALQTNLEIYDRRHDYRGPLGRIDSGDASALAEVKKPGGYGDWEAALIVSVENGRGELVFEDGARATLPAEDLDWASKTFTRPQGGRGLAAGDVVLAEVAWKLLNAEETEPGRGAGEGGTGQDGQPAAQPESEPLRVADSPATLRQVPEVEGALVAMDPHTGRVLAMAGGYSFWKSPFNRVTQSERQPGSAFKPFVYAAALEQGYTPASRFQDTPFVTYDESTRDFWRPSNYTEGRSYGMVTIRRALEKSFNQVTARIANDISMETVSEFAERMGLYEELPPYNAMSLGAGETSMMRMATGYAALVNGGKTVTPTLLDRIQDRYGETLFRHDPRACDGCDDPVWNGEGPPELDDPRPQVLDPVVAYQVTHMLEGVVQRGTGRRALSVGKPLAGKTGTTNDYKDALFYGFSPDLVVGIWVGFDEPRSLGKNEAGGSVAAPIFTDFMKEALEGKPAMPFRIPPGVRLVKVDADTGRLPTASSTDVIVEAFRPGTEPSLTLASDNGLSIFGSTTGGLGALGAPTAGLPQGAGPSEEENGEPGEAVVPDTSINDGTW